MPSELASLARYGVVDLPDEIATLEPLPALVYVALDTHGPIVPMDLNNQHLDMSPGTLYPTLAELEDRGLAERRPHPARPQAEIAETTGPSVGVDDGD